MNTSKDSLNLLLPRPKSIERGNGVASAKALSRVAVAVGTVAGAPASAADEAYELSISPDGARIVASGRRGETHARATLAQLARLSGGVAPCCTIRDWPTFPWRGKVSENQPTNSFQPFNFSTFQLLYPSCSLCSLCPLC